MFTILLLCAALLSAMMMAAWAIQRSTGQSSWIDAMWSFAVGLAGLLATLLSLDQTPTARQWLVAGLIAFWSIRLGGHIARRAATSAHDDPRYAHLREQWGSKFPVRLLLFLQIQALCGLGLAASIYAAAHNPRPDLGWQDAIGAAILLASIIGEAIADSQLRAFSSRPENRGKVCETGLWNWSRHPNYFFEWFGWLAYLIIAVDNSGEYPLGWLALIGPVLMYWLLVYASGIPPLEEHMLRSRGEAFRDYMRRVSAFFPLPPKA